MFATTIGGGAIWRGIGRHGLFACKSVWSTPEHLRSFTIKRYINPRYLYFYLHYLVMLEWLDTSARCCAYI